MNKYLKYVLLFVVTFSISFICINKIDAKTLSELKSELSTAESKYESNQAEKAQTEAQIAATKQKINSINTEKAQVSKDIENLNNELQKLAEDIAKMQAEIKKIVNYFQISNSESPYLEYLFNASNYTDFIYRMAVSEQLSEYREKTINKYNKLIEENKKKISELADKQASLNKLQNELSAQYEKLGSNLSSISDAAIDIKDEIKALKDQVNTYQNTYKCSLTEQLSTCINRYNEANRGNAYLPSAAGFYRPIAAGALNYEYGYTVDYGGYHDGADFGGYNFHGTTVYPVANGTVVKIAYRSSCGGNMVYIAHRVNGQTYTSGYFHLASINVSVGQSVTYNTVIGYAGGDPSIEWWDGCSTGSHLHLQIATGIYTQDYFWYRDYQARSFNPRNVINFPGTRVRFNSR